MTRRINNVCVLIGRKTVPDWFAEAMQTLLENSAIRVPLLVVTENISSSEAAKDVQQRNKIEQLKRRILTPSFLNRNPVDYTPIDKLEVLSDAEYIEADLESAGDIGVKIPKQIVDKVSNRCDIVIHNGVGILQGGILTRVEYGVLSYHHGDIREYRGAAPTGFYQHLNDEEYAGITLQRLNEELDAGEIVAIRKVFIEDADTWYEVQERMYSASTPMLSEAIETIENTNSELITLSESELGKMYYRSDWTIWVRLHSRIKDLMNLYLG